MNRTLWCAIAALTLAGGCSEPRGTGANPPVDIYILASPLRDRGTHGFAVEVEHAPAARSLSAAPDPTQRALEALFAYRAKTPHGWGKPVVTFTAIPLGTKLLSLSVSGHLVTVNAGKALMDTASVESSYDYAHDMRGKCALIALAQIVYTATQQDPTASVQILIEGQYASCLGDSDERIDRPLFRRDLGREVHEKVDKAITGVEGSIYSYVLVDAPAASSAKPGAKPSGGRP